MEFQRANFLNRIAQALRGELLQWRDSLLYSDLETYTGCILAAMWNSGIINEEEEKFLRKRIFDE